MKIKRNCIKTGIQRIDSGINGATLEFSMTAYNPEKFITIKGITDHRINLTLYKVDYIMDGDLKDLIEALTSEHQAG